MDKVLVAIIQILKMEENLDNQKQIVKEMNEFLQIQNAEIEKHCGIVGQLEKEKREHNQKIASLKNQLKDEQKYSDEQDAALAEINRDMEPFKKQNKMLMNIIGAAEKGHNMLLSTMQSINSEISGNL